MEHGGVRRLGQIFAPSESATVLHLGQEITEHGAVRDSVAQAATYIDLESIELPWSDTRSSRLVQAYPKVCACAPSLINELMSEGELRVPGMIAALPWHQAAEGTELGTMIG